MRRPARCVVGLGVEARKSASWVSPVTVDGSTQVVPALECEERLLGEVVDRPRDGRAVEVPEPPEPELDPADRVRVGLLTAHCLPLARPHADAEHGREPPFGCDRGPLLRAETRERGRDLEQARLDRPGGGGSERGARDAHEPGVAVGAKRAEARARPEGGAQPLVALELRRSLEELAQRMTRGRRPSGNGALDANDPAVAHERDLHGRLRPDDRADGLLRRTGGARRLGFRPVHGGSGRGQRRDDEAQQQSAKSHFPDHLFTADRKMPARTRKCTPNAEGAAAAAPSWHPRATRPSRSAAGGRSRRRRCASARSCRSACRRRRPWALRSSSRRPSGR